MIKKTRTTTLALLLSASLTLTSVAQEEEEKELIPLPGWLVEMTADMPADKIEFLQTEDAETFAGSREKLLVILKRKDAAGIEAYVDAALSVFEAAKFNPETDMAAIPLDTENEKFNGWKVERPKELNLDREPGPIHLSRYAQSFDSGIRTFASSPVAIYPEDLIAGEVEVAIVGAPLDMGSYHRGAKFGPAAIRNEYGMDGVDMCTMVDPTKELTIVDYGDIAVDNMSTELTVQHVRERVREIAETGAIPFIIGGDHSLAYPDIAALADVHGKESFGVVHFDSHYDAGRYSPHFISHGQPVYRASKEGHVAGKNYIQVGLRGNWPGAEGFEWMRNNGIRYHAMPEIEKRGWDAVMEDALREAREDGKKLFISFDVDVLDPSVVPGTGTPVPGGLTMREAIPIVRNLCAQNDMVGFELVELAPNLGSAYRSALNSNFIVHACLTGIAMRKKGITENGYLSELTTDHKQPEAGLEAEAAGEAEEIDPDFASGKPPSN